MSGPELVDHLRSVRAGLKVLFMSGYPHRARRGGSALCAPLLSKPFTSTGLAHAVRGVLDGRAAATDEHEAAAGQ